MAVIPSRMPSVVTVPVQAAAPAISVDDVSERAIKTMVFLTSTVTANSGTKIVSTPEQVQEDLKEVANLISLVVNQNYKANIVKYTLSVRIGAVAFSFKPLEGHTPEKSKSVNPAYKSARPVDAVAMLFIVRTLAGLTPNMQKHADLAFVPVAEFATRVGSLCSWLSEKSKGLTFTMADDSLSVTCLRQGLGEYVKPFSTANLNIVQKSA
jgi:hypothetical protein